MLQSFRDQPGTQREYETIYIVRPEVSAEQLDQVNARIKQVIEDASGKLMRVENWGKRKLAYEIEKQTKGIYLYWRYLAPSELVREVERNLRLMDEVIRYLTVKIDQDVDPEARPSDVTPETFVAAATIRPDEEDYYLGRTGEDRDGYDDEDSDDSSDSDDDGDEGSSDADRGRPSKGDGDSDESSDGDDAGDEEEK